MGYKEANFKDVFKNSLEFINIFENNNYTFNSRNLESFSYNKNDFTIIVTTQASGYVSANIVYTKKLNNSTDTLQIKQWLTSNYENLNERIIECENKCLEISNHFN